MRESSCPCRANHAYVWIVIGSAFEGLLALLDPVDEAVAVSLRGEVAAELVDEEPTVREDQDAEVPGRLDEPCRGDRLARRGRVPEPVAARRAGIVAGVAGLLGFLCLAVCELGTPRPPRPPPPRRAPRRLPFEEPLPFSSALLWVAAISSVSIPASASIWCRRSAVPGRGGRGSARRGRARARASGRSAPSSLPTGAVARLDLLDRVVERGCAAPGASATSASSPGWRNGSPNQRSARCAALSRVRQGPGRRVRGDRGFLHVRSCLETRRPVVRNRSRKAAHSGVVRAPASLHPGD